MEPLAYEPFEIGLALDWKIAPPGKALADPGSASVNFAPGHRGYTPLSPVHLSSKIMTTQDVGRVRELVRYPVKSMAGISVESADAPCNPAR